MRAKRLLVACLPALAGLAIGACGIDPGRLFDRQDPEVERARKELSQSYADGGDADLAAAQSALEEVLKFHCDVDGGVDLVVERGNAGLDLGLVVFRVAELLGRRFGDEESPLDGGGGGGDEARERELAARTQHLDCAKLLLGKIANDPATSSSLALRARYLLGNFAFLAHRYQEAIDEYDRVLLVHPARGKDTYDAVPDDEDAVARDAAWNRAIALRRLRDQDAGPDSQDAASDGNDGADDSPDSGKDGGDESGSDGANDSGNDGANDSGSDGSNGRDGASDGGGNDGASEGGGNDGGRDGGGEDAPAPSPSTSAAPRPSTSATYDLRELDRFDNKKPLDLDLLQKLRERSKLPKDRDK